MKLSRILQALRGIPAIIYLWPGMADAGAWPQPVGHVQVIIPFVVTRANEAYDAHSKVVDRNAYRKNELTPYFEYGLSKNLTLIGQLSLIHEKSSWLGSTISNRSLSDIQLGARYGLGSWQDTFFSLQPSLILHGDMSQSDPSASQRGDVDGEFAVTLGRHFKWLGFDGFSDNLIGIRVKPGNRPSEFRANLTLGVNLNTRTMVMLKSEGTSTFSKGAGAAASQSQSNKLGLSFVRRLDKLVSLEVGVASSLTGRNTIKEHSLRAALWYDF